MNMDILYPIVMGAIRSYQLLHSIIIRIFAAPIRKYMNSLFKRTGGIQVNGKNPWDIQVHRSKEFYYKVVQDQSLGFGESYMDGDWDCEQIDELFSRMFKGGIVKELMKFPDCRLIHYLQFHLFNMQTAKRSWEVAEKHYDIGNVLYKSFLDETMTYSCGYWKEAKDLSEAQRHKMELIGRKLKLSPGMRVLDIGCGWGGLSKFLAETYQVHVVGITNSKESAKYGQNLCKELLNVEIRCQDYRDLLKGGEVFDRIVSVGMFEHVGRQNYPEFFKTVEHCLTPKGIFLLHTVGIDSDSILPIEPFVNKYIFPNGCLPDHKNIAQSVDNIFTIEDWHNFGPYYDKTLSAWKENFSRNWPSISGNFENPERFYRMWIFYMSVGAATFRARKFHAWQIVLTKVGNTEEVYESVR